MKTRTRPVAAIRMLRRRDHGGPPNLSVPESARCQFDARDYVFAGPSGRVIAAIRPANAHQFRTIAFLDDGGNVRKVPITPTWEFGYPILAEDGSSILVPDLYDLHEILLPSGDTRRLWRSKEVIPNTDPSRKWPSVDPDVGIIESAAFVSEGVAVQTRQRVVLLERRPGQANVMSSLSGGGGHLSAFFGGCVLVCRPYPYGSGKLVLVGVASGKLHRIGAVELGDHGDGPIWEEQGRLLVQVRGKTDLEPGVYEMDPEAYQSFIEAPVASRSAKPRRSARLKIALETVELPPYGEMLERPLASSEAFGRDDGLQ